MLKQTLLKCFTEYVCLKEDETKHAGIDKFSHMLSNDCTEFKRRQYKRCIENSL